MWLIWFIDFFFNGYVEDLIWHWFFIWQRCSGADLILISCGRRWWGWFGVDFSLKKLYLILRLIWNPFLSFFWGWCWFHLSRCRRSRDWTASFTEEQGREILREFARWVELVGFSNEAPVSSRYFRPPRLKYFFLSNILWRIFSCWSGPWLGESSPRLKGPGGNNSTYAGSCQLKHFQIIILIIFSIMHIILLFKLCSFQLEIFHDIYSEWYITY